MAEFFEARGISKHFGGVAALNDVSMSVQKGEILGLIGPNGAGKSTFLNIAAGFYPQSSGKIAFKGESLDGLESFERSQRRIARTFQRPTVFPYLTSQQCIASAQIGRATRGVWNVLFRRGQAAKDREERFDRAAAILERVDLLPQKDVLASNLPHGDQMLLQLAVAVSNDPELLLLDEPASGLNPTELSRLKGAIKGFNQEGVTIMLVEHRMELVMTLCDRLVVLNKGEKIADGTPAEIQNNPYVIEAYLGTRGTHSA